MSVFSTWDMRCPQCFEDHKIDVAAKIWVRLVPDGTDVDEAQDHDHEWDEKSPAVCRACDFQGTVFDFVDPDR
jgi:hypothetical protein